MHCTICIPKPHSKLHWHSILLWGYSNCSKGIQISQGLSCCFKQTWHRQGKVWAASSRMIRFPALGPLHLPVIHTLWSEADPGWSQLGSRTSPDQKVGNMSLLFLFNFNFIAFPEWSIFKWITQFSSEVFALPIATAFWQLSRQTDLIKRPHLLHASGWNVGAAGSGV